MKIAQWILQTLLALVFLAHGWLFVAPPADMVAMMNASMGETLRYFVGISELLAAVGLVLPSLTRILPWLTPLAAAGLALIVGSATIFHLVRGEPSSALSTAILFVLATFVAYTRWKVTPVPPRKPAYSIAN